ncbi:MAG: DUF5658 family protein [Candidatus Binatia bacterium]
MTVRNERLLTGLVLLNLALQAFDGVATWTGLRAGIPEGNPLLASAMGALGTTPALVAFKLWACGSVLALWRLRHSALAVPALALCAVVYLACSVGPWAAVLTQVHLARLYIAS